MNRYPIGILRRVSKRCSVTAANQVNSTSVQNPGNMNWLEGVIVAKTTAAQVDDNTFINITINSELLIDGDTVQNYYSQNINNLLGYIPIGRILTGNDNMQVGLISGTVSSYNVTFIYAEKTLDFINAARNNQI